MTTIVLVDKDGNLTETKVKDFSFGELYKRCRFKKPDGFERRTIWRSIKIKTGERWTVALYARDNGKANTENKYDLPPPVDSVLYFGAMALVALDENDDSTAINFDVDTWKMIYEKLFGGFHNLADTAQEDEEEEDELADLPSEMKTKHGYMKDDFVVDDSSADHTAAEEETEEEMTDEDCGSELDFEDYENMDSTEDEYTDEEDVEQ